MSFFKVIFNKESNFFFFHRSGCWCVRALAPRSRRRVPVPPASPAAAAGGDASTAGTVRSLSSLLPSGSAAEAFACLGITCWAGNHAVARRKGVRAPAHCLPKPGVVTRNAKCRSGWRGGKGRVEQSPFSFSCWRSR